MEILKINELALFAGAGGGILAGELLGWRTVCAVECNAYAAQVLAQRQNDGILQAFPIWSDVCSFDGRPWRGIVDVISGGFPCQDISVAGEGAGITGTRSGLWKEFVRIIGEVMPGDVFVENSPMLTVRGLGTVLRDLAALGFDAEWGVLSASDVGAPHTRERIWIHGRNAKWKLADTTCNRSEAGGTDSQGGEKRQATELNHSGNDMANTYGERLQGRWRQWPTERPVRLCSGTGGGKSKVYPPPPLDGGRLNPMWVEWLMGWPIGWTELAPLAMDKYQSWLQQHLSY